MVDVTLIVSTLTGSMLLPLLLALFLFSDAHQRRQPVFMAVVLAVFIGLTQSIYSDYVVVRSVSLLELYTCDADTMPVDEPFVPST
jgi:membrane-bound metal-dependent hydrolase YbcI (DUF457 family)